MITIALYGLSFFIPSLFYAALAIGEGLEDALAWYEAINWPFFIGFTFIELLVYLFAVFIIPKLRWQHWKYDVSEKEIDMLRGIFTHKRTLVPINRIQHVDTRQGPIYRKFGLSSVTVSTAATTHEIPALDDETAAELRSIISTLVRKVEEDV